MAAASDGCGWWAGGSSRPFPPAQLTRVRRLRRADGSSAQVVVQAERHVAHVPTGLVVGIAGGLHASVLDWERQAVVNPHFIHYVEPPVTPSHQRLARKSLHHQPEKNSITITRRASAPSTTRIRCGQRPLPRREALQRLPQRRRRPPSQRANQP